MTGIGGQLNTGPALTSRLLLAGREVGSEGASSASCAPRDRKIVILGGDGKGQDFSPLQAAVARHARAVILIGRDGPLIEKTIGAAVGVAIESAGNIDDAVRRARELAQPGDAVLLSPACASFDMFRNYEHRARMSLPRCARWRAPAAGPPQGRCSQTQGIPPLAAE